MSGQGHQCMIKAGAGGLISSDWCIEHFFPVVSALPDDLAESDVARPELLIHDEVYGKRRVQIYYTPFDRTEPHARVLLVGITPGRHQIFLALQAARTALRQGQTPDEAVHRAKHVGGFAGRMRTNAAAMLDEIGLARALGIPSTSDLFADNAAAELRGGTSAFCHAVFVDGKNYTGHGLEQVPVLRAFAAQVLAAEIEMTPNALVVPFGEAAARAVQLSINAGRVSPSRCLIGFPHPSGANGWRLRKFNDAKDAMADAVARWAG